EEEGVGLVGAVAQDRRPDGVDREHRHRRHRAHRLVEEDEVIDLAAALAAVLLRPAEAEPAVARHLLTHRLRLRADAVLADEVLAHRGREQPVVVRSQLLPEALLLLAVADVHLRAPRKRGPRAALRSPGSCEW